MKEQQEKSAFAVLSAIDCNGHTEKKNGLTYLSWAWAWQMVKEHYPTAFYTIYENKDGLLYHTDGRTCWVKTGVTIDGIEHIEYLPVMDYKNSSIPVEKVTSFDVNKAVQRSLTKACARHGLGLYIYAGEDLPSDAKKPEQKQGAKYYNDVADIDDELLRAKQEAKGARSLQSLIDVWNDHADLQLNEDFIKFMQEQKTKFKK